MFVTCVFHWYLTKYSADAFCLNAKSVGIEISIKWTQILRIHVQFAQYINGPGLQGITYAPSHSKLLDLSNGNVQRFVQTTVLVHRNHVVFYKRQLSDSRKLKYIPGDESKGFEQCVQAIIYFCDRLQLQQFICTPGMNMLKNRYSNDVYSSSLTHCENCFHCSQNISSYYLCMMFL